MNKEVKGCDDCLFSGTNDMDVNYHCVVNGKIVKCSEKDYKPITPKWCPLKKESITVTLKR